MIEVQIRRPCSRKDIRESGDGFLTCMECKVGGFNELQNGVIAEWISLERAVQMAHEEAAKEGK